MVNYVGTDRMRDLVARVGAARFMEELAAEIETDYGRWDEFEKSPRHACHSTDGVIELMPISDSTLYSFKYVNGHPKNTAKSLLTVTAFGVLADVHSGYPLLMSEMTFLTALRTASMSALAARHMARAGSRVMAMIGNGAQSEFQALAFHRMLGIRQLRLYDTDKNATAKLMRNLAGLRLPDLEVRPCCSGAEAARSADILTTATADKRNAVIVTPEMVEPGMHLNAVGGDCPGKTELHVDILRTARTHIVVEYEPQARIEGEIQQVGASIGVTEFADLARGAKAGRRDAQQVTIFDSVGFALNDFSALRYVRELDAADRAGASIDLVPSLDDPKDLFGAMGEFGNRLRGRARLAGRVA
jgi:ornithine cyclodeaminase